MPTWTAKKNVQPISYCNGFYEYLPTGYDGVKKFPLIVFMHGLGEVGNGTTQLVNLLNTGLPIYIQRAMDSKQDFQPFIILCPQTTGWSSGVQVNQMIDFALKNYAVDTDRIYVTGLSMGGGATWEFASQFADRAAAVAAICPAAGASAAGLDLIAKSGLGCIGFHAKDDPTCPVSNTINTIDGLNARNISPMAEKVITETGGHGIWNGYYDPSYGLYEKLLTYKRSSVVAPPTSVKFAPKALNGWNSDASVRLGGNYTNTMMIWGFNPVIAGAADSALYCQEAFDAMSYRIPVQNGSYTVRLHFAEIFHNSAGARVFNVDIEGQRMLSNFDVWAAAGGRFKAVQRDFTVNVTDGRIDINFINVVDKAKVSAIEIIPGTVTYQTNVEIQDLATGAVLKTYSDTFSKPVKVVVN